MKASKELTLALRDYLNVVEYGIGLNGRFADDVGYSPVAIYSGGIARSLPTYLRSVIPFPVPDDADVLVITPIKEPYVVILTLRALDDDGDMTYAYVASYDAGASLGSWSSRLNRSTLHPYELVQFFEAWDKAPVYA